MQINTDRIAATLTRRAISRLFRAANRGEPISVSDLGHAQLSAVALGRALDPGAAIMRREPVTRTYRPRVRTWVMVRVPSIDRRYGRGCATVTIYD